LELTALSGLSDNIIAEKLRPILWYLRDGNYWIWRYNAIRAMANTYEPKYKPYILRALQDENENVRAVARWACAQLGILSCPNKR
jgi:HEAT repeat protein